MGKTINPDPGVLKELAETVDAEAPVTMINLLRFNQHAVYEDGTQCTGKEAYIAYGKHAYNFVEGVGGKVIFHGAVKGLIISPKEDRWDEALLVTYPNFAAFMAMIMNPDYQAITHHRTAALFDSRLWATQSE